MPGTFISAVDVLSCLISRTGLQNMYYGHLHSTSRKTEE